MNKKNSIDTSVLMDALTANEDFDTFEERHNENMGLDHLKLALRKAVAKSHFEMVEIFDRAGIPRSYGYQILNGRRQPSRDKLIQLSFGMANTLEETDYLLKSSNKQTLYAKVPRDALIIHSLIHNNSLDDTNVLLLKKGHQPLK